MSNSERIKNTPTPLWRTRDVSAYLNVPESTVRYWVSIRAIRYHKLGSLTRYVPDEVIEDFREGRIGSYTPRRRKPSPAPQ